MRDASRYNEVALPTGNTTKFTRERRFALPNELINYICLYDKNDNSVSKKIDHKYATHVIIIQIIFHLNKFYKEFITTNILRYIRSYIIQNNYDSSISYTIHTRTIVTNSNYKSYNIKIFNPLKLKSITVTDGYICLVGGTYHVTLDSDNDYYEYNLTIKWYSNRKCIMNKYESIYKKVTYNYDSHINMWILRKLKIPENQTEIYLEWIFHTDKILRLKSIIIDGTYFNM